MKEKKRTERLKDWIDTLSDEQKYTVILDLTELAINAEYVSFWDDTIAPYYESDGESLDGIERDVN